MQTMLLGAHESVAGGLERVFSRAEEDGCESVQVFTRSGRRWESPPLKPEEIAAFRAAGQQSSVRVVVAHCSYLFNLAAPDSELRHRSQAAMGAELDRCEALGIPFVVLHPGAAGAGEDVERGIVRIARALDELLTARPGMRTTICLENTAGQGNAVGHRFEHLRGIIEQMEHGARIGVCLDTAHLFAAGYDLCSEEGYRTTWAAFAEQVGWARLRVLHLNDTQKKLGSRTDRHTKIGTGLLGLETFRRLLHEPRLAGLPGILESPVDFKQPTPFKEELALLRSLLG